MRVEWLAIIVLVALLIWDYFERKVYIDIVEMKESVIKMQELEIDALDREIIRICENCKVEVADEKSKC